MIRAHTYLLLTLLLASPVSAELTSNQKQSREHGLALYQQSDWYDSQPLLEIAAKAGDSESQYYLGEAIRLSSRYMTADAAKWYSAAANQGDLYAMLRLSNAQDLCTFLTDCAHDAAEWREKVIEQGYQRSEQGDTTAMIALYMAGQGLDWLEKAADLGDHYAQYMLAGFYESGSGWFLTSERREKAVESLFKAAAEGGYAPAMLRYTGFLAKSQKHKEIQKWTKLSAEKGYISGAFNYAVYSLHSPKEHNFPLDKIKGYGLLLLISQLEGGGGAAQDAQYKLDEIRPLMKEDEIARAIQFSKEWEASHPPLSYFVPVYGF